MTHKIATSIFALATVLSSAAYAADINGRGSIKDSPFVDNGTPHRINWSGVYVGAHLGTSFENHEINLDVQDYDYESESTQTYNLFNLDGLSGYGILGGLDAGVDLRRGNMVFGLLGFYDFNDVTIDASAFNGAISASVEKGDQWGIGGRFGPLLDERNLLYIAVLYVQSEYTVKFQGAEIAQQDADGIQGRLGWEHAFGGGVFSDFSVGYTGYDTIKWINEDGVTLKDDPSALDAKLGLKYRIGGAVPGLESLTQ